MGSTSYDEARDPQDPNDPTWSGASWYGPSTGEYWIINPREYADPRKHGPEYQSRARRMAAAAAMGGNGAGGIDGGDGASDGFDDELDRDIGADAFDPPADDTPRAGQTASVGAAWTFPSGSAPGSPARGRSASRSTPSRPARDTWGREPLTTARGEGPRSTAAAGTADWSATWPADGRSGGRNDGLARRAASARDWLGGPADDPVRRLGIALVAWPPIGLAAAALIGDVTGCAAYAATCIGTEPLLPWLAQAVILGLLLLLPPVARVLAGGAVGVLAALVPLTAFLVAVGGTGAPQAGFALAFMLGLAWLLGIVWGIAQTRRRGIARAGP